MFKHSEKYVSVIQALAYQRYGLTKERLLKEAKLSSGSTSTKILQELEESGFLLYIPNIGKKKKGGSYRLIDEYSLFYQFWIQKISHSIITSNDPNYWQRQQQSQRFAVWAGYAFKNLCYRHIPQIKQALGLAAVSTIDTSWQGGIDETENAKVDLVIDRADQCINLCEMKYYNKELRIDKKFRDELERKRLLFQKATETKKSLFTTLITLHGVNEGGYFGSAIDASLSLKGLFL